ncbi:hypothetical protein Pcinc_016072 [Petrolisthes cinctipes]|uniref:Protein sleepless n=1 Tax=Petrolisthes cinctipes TaxID=88211 RepID=A0AAE1KPU9_PETCI|nr:hypothetical protein Pcinc_016072 [Petrolisthes cinctipes]
MNVCSRKLRVVRRAAYLILVQGLAIKCYVCNSHSHDDCKALETKKGDYLEECGDDPQGHKYTLCRKIDMYLDMDFGPLHPAEKRVHRACGFKESEVVVDEKDCYYKSGYNTRSWVCSCKEDGCNSATLPSTTALLLPLAALTAVLRGIY